MTTFRLIALCSLVLMATELWGIDSRLLLRPDELPAPSSRPAALPTSPAESVRTQPKVTKRKVHSAAVPSQVVEKAVASPGGSKVSAKGRRRVTTAHSLRINGEKGGGIVDRVSPVLAVWPRIAGPGASKRSEPLSFQRPDFSLSLDSSRYPVLETSEGRRIVLDTAGTIPPLVQSLVRTVDPNVRFVTEDPSDRRRFLGAILRSAGFYSVEESFRFSSGSDPLLTVDADFKVERRHDSLMGQEIVLVNDNVGRAPYSASLRHYLSTQGFTVVEPYEAEYRPPRGRFPGGRILRLSGDGGGATVDRILELLDVGYERDALLTLFSAPLDGVDLKVRADRSFRLNGVPYVIGFFRGDPVAYTLTRLLETRGYRVVMISERDAPGDLSHKVIQGLRLPMVSGFQRIPLPTDSPFSFALSGIHFQTPNRDPLFVILTDRHIDPPLRSIIEEAGYVVTE